MHSIWKHWRPFISQFLAFCLAVEPICALGADLDIRAIWEKGFQKSQPIQERLLSHYLQIPTGDHKRLDALQKWFDEQPSHKAVVDLYLDFEKENPTIAKAFKKQNANMVLDIEKFVSESALLFKFIKSQRGDLIRNQLNHWRAMWTEVDFKWLGSKNAKIWSQKLREFFALGFVLAGPWSTDELAKAQLSLENSPVIGTDSRWANNFRYRMDQGEIQSFLDGVQRGGGFMLYYGVRPLAWFTIPLVELGNIVNHLGDDNFGAYASIAIPLFIFAYYFSIKALQKIAHEARITPFLQMPFNSNISYMLRDGPLTCDELLRDGQP